MQPKVLTASGLVRAGTGKIYALTITAGADAASVTLMDEIGAAGDQLYPIVKAPLETTVHLTFPTGLIFGVGCYAVITGTSPEIGLDYI